MDDRVLEYLADLPPVTPDVEWEARVRARAHEAIARKASRKMSKKGAGLLDLAGAAALCVYLAVAIAELVRLAG